MAILDNFKKSIELARAMYDIDSNLRCQHFSFVFFKSRLMVVGKNTKKTSPWNLVNPKAGTDGSDISGIRGQCSEWSAVNRLKRLTNVPFKKCTLFNVRIDRNQKVSMAKPCPSCGKLLSFAEFDNVFYTDYQGNLIQYY